jgi:cyclic-di-GMP-binding biofilm dispersal mediator protein
MARDLNGAAVLLAGASGGLGTAIGRALTDRGATLTLLGRSEEHLASCALAGLGGPHVAGDIADPDTGVRAVQAHLDAHGRLDGVVNAAGEVAFGPLEETDDATLERLVASNLLGPLRLVRAALPHLDGGFVANLSAVVAEQPPAGMAAYAATKAGLTAADTSLRRELRRRRIDVIDARPPHTETGLAGRPIGGEPPPLPEGLAPEAVAERIVVAIEQGERDVPAAEFAGEPAR